MCEEPRAEVLIPQHHLLYESKFNIESCNIPYNGIVLDANYVDICRMHEQLHTALNHFWERYQNEYIDELREYQRCNAKLNHEKEICRGDIDNKVKGVIVRYIKNTTMFRITRPINKLYPTECKKDKDEVIL